MKKIFLSSIGLLVMIFSLMLGAQEMDSSSYFPLKITNHRVLDGNWVHQCKSLNDVYEQRLGSYEAFVQQAQVVEGQLFLTFQFKFYRCVQKQEGDFGFQPVSPLKNLVYVMPYPGAPEESIVQVTPLRADFMMTLRDRYEFIADVILTNEARQELTLNLSLKKLLSQKDYDLFLQKGVLNLSFDYWVRRALLFQNLKTRYQQVDPWSSYGLRRVILKSKTKN